MNVPNTLTLVRIALIPIFVIVFYLPIKWSHVATAVIFALAALTDWLDGYLARRLGQTSALGAFLDPVADKLMVAVVLVFLLQQNPSPWLALPAAIIIGREITISFTLWNANGQSILQLTSPDQPTLLPNEQVERRVTDQRAHPRPGG